MVHVDTEARHSQAASASKLHVSRKIDARHSVHDLLQDSIDNVHFMLVIPRVTRVLKGCSTAHAIPTPA